MEHTFGADLIKAEELLPLLWVKITILVSVERVEFGEDTVPGEVGMEAFIVIGDRLWDGASESSSLWSHNLQDIIADQDLGVDVKYSKAVVSEGVDEFEPGRSIDWKIWRHIHAVNGAVSDIKAFAVRTGVWPTGVGVFGGNSFAHL
jgi:hypothetical protein